MPALPEKQILIQSVSGHLNRRIIFLLILAVVFLLVNVFLVKFGSQFLRPREQKITSFVESFKKETSGLQFPGFHWNERFFDNLSKVSSGDNPNEQFRLLSDNFEILKWTYADSHDAPVRQSALNLRGFIEKKFPKDYSAKINQFEIPCLDPTCPSINPPEDIREIISLVKEAGFEEPLRQKSILDKLETAVLVADENEKFNNFHTAFLDIRAEWKATKNFKVKTIGEKLLNVIQVNYPERYDDIKKTDVYDLR